MEPTNIKALYRRASARLSLHHLSDAFSDASRAHELAPDNHDVSKLLEQVTMSTPMHSAMPRA